MVRHMFMQRCLLQRPKLKNKIRVKFWLNLDQTCMHIQKHYIRFNIFIIRALTNDTLSSSSAGFSLLRICCTRIIVSFGIPDNDSVV